MNERTKNLSDGAGVFYRFDDVSINTNIIKLRHLLEIIKHYQPKANILLCISPITFSPLIQLPLNHQERVHPTKLTAGSSLSAYYEGNRCGIPHHIMGWREPTRRILFAGHGIVHVDHRLLGYQAQELSIVTSCSLAGAKIFVPPYNKWNEDTATICKKHDITLIRFEDGWEHMLYNSYRPSHEGGQRWYMHPYDMTPGQLQEWFVK